MLNGGVTLGQYFPGRSFLHRMDPRMKLILTLAYIVMVFLPKNWIGLAVSIAFLAVSAVVSKLPARLLWRSVKPILPLILFTSVINMFYLKDGAPLVDVWIVHITTGGVITALFISVRILCLIMGTSLLTYTTSPTALTDALERILYPLTLLHIKVHTLAMMMTIALRFVPTLMDETDKIMSAQKARGADLESGNLIQRVKALLPILIPLFVSSFRHAIELATAMECRCYHGGDGRTRMKQLRLRVSDWVSAAVFCAVLASVILLNVWISPVI